MSSAVRLKDVCFKPEEGLQTSPEWWVKKASEHKLLQIHTVQLNKPRLLKNLFAPIDQIRITRSIDSAHTKPTYEVRPEYDLEGNKLSYTDVFNPTPIRIN
jgi:hypothetical protein